MSAIGNSYRAFFIQVRFIQVRSGEVRCGEVWWSERRMRCGWVRGGRGEDEVRMR